MANWSTVILGTLTVLSAVHVVFKAWLAHQKRVRFGCQPAVQYPHRLPWLLDPWGSDVVRRRLEGYAEGRFQTLFKEQFAMCGSTFEERSPKGTLLCTTDDDNWRTILSLKSSDYYKKEARSSSTWRFTGPGTLSNEGLAWRHSRDLVRPLFARAELSDVERFEKHVNRLLRVVPREGQTVNMMPLILRLFLDNGTEFVFGESLDCLGGDGSSTEVDEMVRAFKACRRSLGLKRVLGSKDSKIPFLRDVEFERNVDTLHAFIDRRVARALERNRGQADKSQTRYILLDELAKDVSDPVTLRFETLHVFLPSFQTMGNAFSTVLFHLARSPDIWADLRSQALALGDEPLTLEKIKSLHAFRDAIQEGTRLLGSSGRISRTALRDTVIPHGGGPDGRSPVLVPKGRTVMLEMYAKMRDPAVWGEDADEFRPSRFQGRRLKWDYVAFSGGPRICPAKQQALTQMIYLLVRLVKEFEVFENRDPCMEFMDSVDLVPESRNGVQVALYEYRTDVK